MTKYIVAYLNAHNNNLTQTLIEANTDVQACLVYLAKHEDIIFTEDELSCNISLKELKYRMFDIDICISAYALE